MIDVGLFIAYYGGANSYTLYTFIAEFAYTKRGRSLLIVIYLFFYIMNTEIHTI